MADYPDARKGNWFVDLIMGTCVLGSLGIGVIALFAALKFSDSSASAMASSVAFIASGLSFGLLANALWRR